MLAEELPGLACMAAKGTSLNALEGAAAAALEAAGVDPKLMRSDDPKTTVLKSGTWARTAAACRRTCPLRPDP